MKLTSSWNLFSVEKYFVEIEGTDFQKNIS